MGETFHSSSSFTTTNPSCMNLQLAGVYPAEAHALLSPIRLYIMFLAPWWPMASIISIMPIIPALFPRSTLSGGGDAALCHRDQLGFFL